MPLGRISELPGKGGAYALPNEGFLFQLPVTGRALNIGQFHGERTA
jgi:hypothetical protein